MIRIGNCSGYYGDQLSAMKDMLEGGPLDYLTGDWLAELTMLILGRDQLKNPELGYAKTFVTQMTESMALAKSKGVKIVSNAGGLNPAGLANKLREIAAEQGLEINIAHIEGDNIIERAAEFGFGNALTANAYLGAFGIAQALQAGADVVVTGRVTDASVIVGPAIAHYGWGREDFDQLASAVAAGHIIECGTQATGGNFSGFTEIPDMMNLGFPIAEIDENGDFTITKHENTGGAVTVDTVTAQLMYEITGHVYLNPDVTTHFDSMTVIQEGEDRVRVRGVKGSAPPETTKVSLNEMGGYRNRIEFLLTGLEIEAKAELIKKQMEAAISANRPEVVEWTLDRTDHLNPATQALGTASLRIDVKSKSAEPVGRAFSDAAANVALASYPGFYLMQRPVPGTPYGVFRAGYVPQEKVPHVLVLQDGSRIDIAHPSNVVPAPDLRVSAVTNFDGEHEDVGEERVVAFGRLIHARSGDKGGDGNIGVWIAADNPSRDDAYNWLKHFLTIDRVRELLPESAELDIDIHHFDNLRSINVVIHGILGEGVAASTRLDPQAKALGEWLRSREVSVPARLVAE